MLRTRYNGAYIKRVYESRLSYDMCTQRTPYNWSELLYQKHGEVCFWRFDCNILIIFDVRRLLAATSVTLCSPVSKRALVSTYYERLSDAGTTISP